MASKTPEIKPSDDARIKFLLAEYAALRDEIHYRNSNHYQMISLNLIIAASIITFGLQSSSPASALFVTPVISMLLAMVSAHNVIAGKWLGVIIKNDIEPEFHLSRREKVTKRHSFPGSLGVIAANGTFITTGTLSLLLGLLKIQTYTALDTVLIAVDSLALVITLVLAIIAARRMQEKI